MKTKKLLFVLGLFFVCLQTNAQLNVFPNGKVGIGTMNPKYGTLEIGKSGVNGGLAIYDSLSNTPAFKLYSQGDYGHLNFGGVAWQGLTIKKDGRICLGHNSNNYSSYDFLNIYIDDVTPACAMSVRVQFPWNYGDVVKVVSYNNTDVAYCVRDASQGGYTSRYLVMVGYTLRGAI